MHDVAEVGDVFELRGPIGGWFTWTGEQPALCVVGGSGVVPAISMARYAHRLGLASMTRIVAVGRTATSLPYAREPERYGAFLALTRENHGDRVAHPPYPDEVLPLADGVERAYVCGSVGFASFGHAAARPGRRTRGHDQGGAVRRDVLSRRGRLLGTTGFEAPR